MRFTSRSEQLHADIDASVATRWPEVKVKGLSSKRAQVRPGDDSKLALLT